MMRGEADGRLSRRKSVRQVNAAGGATSPPAGSTEQIVAINTPAASRRQAEASGSVARRRSVRNVKRTGTLRRPGGAGGGPATVGSLRKRSSLRNANYHLDKDDI
jgi:hypothetical protein